jgi:spore coat polysaccharide biosynthesis protein SpsF (cytidylyltransferase family)
MNVINISGRSAMQTLIDDEKIKDLFKKAIIEAMEERKDLVYDVLQDVMEDILLVKAIQEGEDSEVVERDEIFQILDDKRSIASL